VFLEAKNEKSLSIRSGEISLLPDPRSFDQGPRSRSERYDTNAELRDFGSLTLPMMLFDGNIYQHAVLNDASTFKLPLNPFANYMSSGFMYAEKRPAFELKTERQVSVHGTNVTVAGKNLAVDDPRVIDCRIRSCAYNPQSKGIAMIEAIDSTGRMIPQEFLKAQILTLVNEWDYFPSGQHEFQGRDFIEKVAYNPTDVRPYEDYNEMLSKYEGVIGRPAFKLFFSEKDQLWVDPPAYWERAFLRREEEYLKTYALYVKPLEMNRLLQEAYKLADRFSKADFQTAIKILDQSIAMWDEAYAVRQKLPRELGELLISNPKSTLLLASAYLSWGIRDFETAGRRLGEARTVSIEHDRATEFPNAALELSARLDIEQAGNAATSDDEARKLCEVSIGKAGAIPDGYENTDSIPSFMRKSINRTRDIEGGIAARESLPRMASFEMKFRCGRILDAAIEDGLLEFADSSIPEQISKRMKILDRANDLCLGQAVILEPVKELRSRVYYNAAKNSSVDDNQSKSWFDQSIEIAKTLVNPDYIDRHPALGIPDRVASTLRSVRNEKIPRLLDEIAYEAGRTFLGRTRESWDLAKEEIRTLEVRVDELNTNIPERIDAKWNEIPHDLLKISVDELTTQIPKKMSIVNAIADKSIKRGETVASYFETLRISESGRNVPLPQRELEELPTSEEVRDGFLRRIKEANIDLLKCRSAFRLGYAHALRDDVDSYIKSLAMAAGSVIDAKEFTVLLGTQ
jgi:hypothetical protein